MERPNPEFNAGYRYARKLIDAHLASRLRALKLGDLEENRLAIGELSALRRWDRQMPKRAAAKPGGAGRK